VAAGGRGAGVSRGSGGPPGRTLTSGIAASGATELIVTEFYRLSAVVAVRMDQAWCVAGRETMAVSSGPG
jgi:hypothetical protein